MKVWFTRLKQAVTGRLLTLKHKFGRAHFQKLGAMIHARMTEAREWLEESWLIIKCAVLIGLCKLQMSLAPDALKGYWQWLKNLPSQFTRENFKKWGLALWSWICRLPQTLKDLRKHGVLTSVALLLLLIFLGNGATRAWMTYTTPVERNTFQVGKMDLLVEYKQDPSADFVEVTSDSAIFKDEALYEPGYTQVVYLKITNRGNVPFRYKLAAISYESIPSINVYDQEFQLDDYLCYGVLFDDDLNDLIAAASPRKAAQIHANIPVSDNLRTLSKIREDITLNQGDTDYAALIVWMPEYVDNHANYRRGEEPPQITLGLQVYAQQADAPLS